MDRHEELAPAHQYNQRTSGETVHVFADEIGGIDDHDHISYLGGSFIPRSHKTSTIAWRTLTR